MIEIILPNHTKSKELSIAGRGGGEIDDIYKIKSKITCTNYKVITQYFWSRFQNTAQQS